MLGTKSVLDKHQLSLWHFMQEQSFQSKGECFRGDKKGLIDDEKWYKMTRFNNLEDILSTYYV